MRLLIVTDRLPPRDGPGSLLAELLPRLTLEHELVQGSGEGLGARAALELAVRRTSARLRPERVLAVGPSVAAACPVLRMATEPVPAQGLRARLRGRRSDAATSLIPTPASAALLGEGPAVGTGIDAHRFQPWDGGERGGPLRVLFLGRLVPSRGAHLAIEAMQGLPGWARESSQLDVVGAGVDPVYLARLRGRAQGSATRLHVDVPDVLPFLRQADVALLPRTAEDGWGRALLEAMAVGLPVITSRGGVLDALCGGAAVQVPAGNLKEIGDALRRLLRDREARRSLGAAARAQVLSQHDWSVTLPRWEAAIRAAR